MGEPAAGHVRGRVPSIVHLDLESYTLGGRLHPMDESDRAQLQEIHAMLKELLTILKEYEPLLKRFQHPTSVWKRR